VIPKHSRVGDRYQKETKYSRESMGGGFLDWEKMPEAFKQYPQALQVLKLPPAKQDEGLGLWQILSRRRSERDFNRSPISLQDLSQLLFSTQGVTGKVSGYLLRTAPSAGALYPIETYLAVKRVASLTPGLYHFNIVKNALELLQERDITPALCKAALDQTMVKESAVVFIWTAVVARSKWKYRERAYRYIYMDAGHIGQNLYLAAVALGLGCCTIGAFFDDEVNEILNVDGTEETAVYMGVAGKCV
jgi:SagB-type dehydrogenase family enzyme